MYLPKMFREDDLAVLHGLIRENSFGILITQHDGAPFASHLPFLLDETRGPHGTLLAHMARANPQWRDFEAGQEALAIFHGPHAYVSPSWYDAVPSVPTWNYAAVHAYGAPRIVEDPAALRELLERLVDLHESAFERPWPMRLPDEYLHKMMHGIVGFEIEIARIEGKLKLSQNRAEGERHRVAEALGASADSSIAGVGAMMRARESA
jgi:transcriptional regulator